MQLRQVPRPTLDQVAVRVRRDADGHRRDRHQRRIRRLLPAEDDDGPTGRRHGGQLGVVLLRRAEQPDDSEVSGGRELGQRATSQRAGLVRT